MQPLSITDQHHSALEACRTSTQRTLNLETTDDSCSANIAFDGLDEIESKKTRLGDAFLSLELSCPTPRRRFSRCSVCEAVMLTRVLRRHMRTVHDGRDHETYKCEKCDCTVKRKDILTRHIREQHGNKTGVVQCGLCNKPVRERYLKDHCRSDACLAARIRPKPRTRNAGPHPSPEEVEVANAGLDLIGRFSAATVLAPSDVVARIFTEVGHYEFSVDSYCSNAISEKIWDLRGMALRTVMKISQNTVQSVEERLNFYFGLSDMIVLDGCLGLSSLALMHLAHLARLDLSVSMERLPPEITEYTCRKTVDFGMKVDGHSLGCWFERVNGGVVEVRECQINLTGIQIGRNVNVSIMEDEHVDSKHLYLLTYM